MATEVELFNAAVVSALPHGMIVAHAGKTVPDGFLLCNGAAVSRKTYAKLFEAIGELWGAGDGSTTFNLPDSDGRVLQGATDVSKVGKYLEAGLPNITGAVGRKNGVQQGGQCFSDCGLQNIQMVGALYATAAGKQFDLGNSTVSDETASVVNIDASRISSIYSNETSVQPPALQILIIIKI